jgi:hypothetical protein
VVATGGYMIELFTHNITLYTDYETIARYITRSLAFAVVKNHIRIILKLVFNREDMRVGLNHGDQDAFAVSCK